MLGKQGKDCNYLPHDHNGPFLWCVIDCPDEKYLVWNVMDLVLGAIVGETDLFGGNQQRAVPQIYCIVGSKYVPVYTTSLQIKARLTDNLTPQGSSSC